ncbi:hypothetical protein ES702_01016 [subsurface metagenome]
MTTYKNEFSWSVSRDATFQKCQRMYYYQYYGSWGGWNDDADDITRTVYMLKQLQNRQMWAGKKVHECIEKTLKKIQDGINVNNEESIEDTLNVMRKEFKSSIAKRYLIDPKTCALFEHEYELPITNTEWKNNADHVVECLKLFFDSNVYKDILQLSSKQWLEVEQFSSFFYRDIKIYAVFDFAYRNSDEVIIYDWKTGKKENDKHKLQLACYGLFATKKWEIKPEHVKLMEFYLSSSKQNEYNFSEFDLDNIQKHIWSSIGKMQNKLDDPQANIASEDRFLCSENKQICQHCNYLRICSK